MRQAFGDVPLGGSPFPPIADFASLSDCESCALVAPSGNEMHMECEPHMDYGRKGVDWEIRADQHLATTQPLLEARRREVPAQ
jgi:hypothetical protein